MPTLEEVLSEDLGLGNEKTAGEQPADTQESDNEIAKLAEQIGLVEGTEKTAGEATENNETVKEAQMELGSIYEDMFPEDAGLEVSAQEKTAAEEKTAQEEQLGGRAFDYFAERFSNRMDKMAAEMSGDANVSASEGSVASNKGNPHSDSRPPQAQPGNKPGDAKGAIDTKPAVTDIVTPQKGGEVVGEESDKSSEVTKAAAVRKHLIMAMLTK